MRRTALLLALGGPADARAVECSFASHAALVIPTNTASSAIAVDSVVSPVTDVAVRLLGLAETTNGLEELDVLLVSPAGDEIVLLSFACLATFGPVTLEFSRDATEPIPSADLFDGDTCSSATYLPGDYHEIVDGGYVLKSPPAPNDPYPGTLDDLVGIDANGTWTLWAATAVPQDNASLQSWQLVIEAAGCGEPTAIFADGFEGDTLCAWSAAVGGTDCP